MIRYIDYQAMPYHQLECIGIVIDMTTSSCMLVQNTWNINLQILQMNKDTSIQQLALEFIQDIIQRDKPRRYLSLDQCM